MSKKAALHNLGCKVNAYETEAMQEMLEKAGYEIVPFKEGADVYVINTCTVTNIADRKSRQMLHRARKMNPDAVVVAAGCYVQAQEGKVDSCIDIVLGNNKKKDLIRILDEYRKSRAESGREKEILPDVELEDIGHTKEYESLNLTRPGDHTRAYIKVQDGCNQFCTYCIIPYARGRVRSRSMEDVTEEVRTLAENGYKEVVLTGIHLSSYGIDFDKERHLLDLIRAVHQIEGSRESGLVHWNREYHRRICKCNFKVTKDVSTFPSLTAEWLRCDIEAYEPEIYKRRICRTLWYPEKVF